MSDENFERVCSPEQTALLGDQAKRIWNEHFVPIIGQAQVDYMVEKFQSPPAMRRQMAQEGYQYYFIREGKQVRGYTALRMDEDRLFISKLYVEKPYRGRGLSRKALNFAEGLCREKGFRKLWLTVNRHNERTIAIYERMGFYKAREQAADIGGGFVMDDYIMEKDLD